MTRRGKLGKVTRRRVTDLAVSTYGQIPIALEGVAAEKTKSVSGLTGPVGKVAGAGFKEFKRVQGVFGEGSRDNGFDRGLDILINLTRPDGSLSREATEGARDALLGRQQQNDHPDYERAHREFQHAHNHLPENDSDYPRTEDGYRGGLLAAAATAYSFVNGEPMLGRIHRAVTSSKTKGWRPGNLAFGPGASVAGSTLDAVKEIVERSTDETKDAAKQLDGLTSSVESWKNLLTQADSMSDVGGLDGAVTAAHRAVESIERASKILSPATELIESWAKDL